MVHSFTLCTIVSAFLTTFHSESIAMSRSNQSASKSSDNADQSGEFSLDGEFNIKPKKGFLGSLGVKMSQRRLLPVTTKSSEGQHLAAVDEAESLDVSSEPFTLPSSTMRPARSAEKFGGQSIRNFDLAPSRASTRILLAPTEENDNFHYNLPCTPEELSEAQKSDPVIRKHVSLNTKGFRVKPVDGFPVVFFRNKIYVPASLREATIRYFVVTVEETIRQGCVWPDISEDVSSFLNDNLMGGVYGDMGGDDSDA